VVPAVHKLRSGVPQVFEPTLGAEPGNDDVHDLACPDWGRCNQQMLGFPLS